MKQGFSRLGSAQALWNDYVGTAAADDADAVLDTRSLYEITGLPRDQWRVVGVDFSLGDAGKGATLYAVEQAVEVAEPAVDEVVVTAFPLEASEQLDRFLTEAFKRISVRLLSSVVADKRIIVADRAAQPQTIS